MLLGCCYHKTEHAQWEPMSKELADLLQSEEKKCPLNESMNVKSEVLSKTICLIDGASAMSVESITEESKDTMIKSDHDEFITKFGLRLASQETKERYRATYY